MEDRRKSPRKVLSQSPLFFWRGRSGAHEGCFFDVSLGGCFVNTLGAVEPGESVSFELFDPPGEVVGFSGRVVHKCNPRLAGFGMSFTVCSANAESYLQMLMAR